MMNVLATILIATSPISGLSDQKSDAACVHVAADFNLSREYCEQAAPEYDSNPDEGLLSCKLFETMHCYWNDGGAEYDQE